MGFATVTDLDDLEWKVWPKTPTFLYVDLNEDVRLQKDMLKHSMGQVMIYAIKFEHADGRKDRILHLTKAQVMFWLKEIDKWSPCLPLVRKSPYEPMD